MATPIQSKSPEKKPPFEQGVFDEKITWIPEEEAKAAFEMAKSEVGRMLKNRYGRRKIVRKSAIEQYQAILLGEEIVMMLSESGISAVELLEWINERAEKKVESVKKEMAKAA